MRLFFLMLVFLVESPSVRAAKYRKVNCDFIENIAKEAVEYNITGAAGTNLSLKCTKNMVWKYFNPDTEEHQPEGGEKPPKFLYFGKNDSYKILKIQPVDERYDIHVEFAIAGKTKKVIYGYQPWDLLEKNIGVCGFTWNDEQPIVLREECKK